MELKLAGKNSTGAQQMTGEFYLRDPGSPTAGYGDLAVGIVEVGGPFGGEATEDSTGALTFDVTINHSSSDALLSIRAKMRIIELLP
jgi:hypothetical protein